MNKKYLFPLVVVAVLVALFLWHRVAGVLAAVVVGLLWAVNKASDMQTAELIKKHGPELAAKIQSKQVEIGMHRVVVELIWGKGANGKGMTDATGNTLVCDHMQVEEAGRKRYRYYAIYKNEVLIEFGDKK